MAELQPAVLFRYENWIHAVSQAESQNEARIDVNVAFNGYRYWTLIFSQRASKGTGARYQDGFVIGMSGGNNDTQNWIGEVEDLDVKMIRRGSNNFTATNGYVRDVTQYIGHIYYNWYHGYEDLVTYKFVCDTQTKTVRCYINQAYMGYGPLNFPTTEYSNGRLEVLKTWAQLGDSNCISYLGDVWLWGCQTLEDAEDYNGGYNPGHKSHGEFLVHHSTHPSGRKMVSDSSHRMYGWKIGDAYDPPVPPDPPEPALRTVTLVQTSGGTISANPMSGYDGDTVTLSNTPSTNYRFDGYTVNGATLYDGNKFNFDGSNVTCSGSWTYTPQILIDAVYLTYFNSPTPKNTSSIYTWTDNPVICVPSNTPVSTNHMATGYTYSSSSKIDNQLVQLDGSYSGKTGIRSNIPEVGRMYTIGSTTYSSIGLDTHFDFQGPNAYKQYKSLVFRFKVDLSSAITGNHAIARYETRLSYANLYHLDCWYDRSSNMGLELYIGDLDKEASLQSLTLYNGAKYPTRRSYSFETIKKHYVTIPGTTKSVWHQCAIVYDNGYLNFFVDGVIYASWLGGNDKCYGIGCEGSNDYGRNYTPAYITEFLLTNYDIRTSPTTCMTWDTPLV